MFDKILIANRGEIACRIIKTAHRLGIATVAVYSEADAEALHVQMADEAILIGPAAVNESYLCIDKIVEAMIKTSAQAVHPGYGFLSENQNFAEAVVAAGLVFIGPPATAIAAMGDKIESKKLAQAAGVNTVPGYLQPIPDAKTAVEICADIGFPVMLKASAGGGGKGMRVAWNREQAAEGYTSAQAEARSSFGDDRVFAEKFVDQPRHIEIQILADQHGTIVHLGERECSIQRRHQKVLEEAPSPFLDPDMRAEMGAQAITLAQRVGYQSAGTVEFVVDEARNFYFLEMNTRLQVEHPVTEMITGLDLVEQMLRIAAGEKLGFDQSAIHLKGSAIEVRLYAENPEQEFMPSIGRLVRYCEPDIASSGPVRVDTGVREGSEITVFYDPMISKLIAHAPERKDAIDYLLGALDMYAIRGLDHNAAFLAAILDHPRFRAGNLTTNFIAEEFPEGFTPKMPDPKTGRKLALIVASLHARLMRHAASGRQVTQHQNWIVKPANKCWADTHWKVNLTFVPIEPSSDLRGSEWMAEAVIDNVPCTIISIWRPGQLIFQGVVEGEPIKVQLDRRRLGFWIRHRGFMGEFLVLSDLEAVLLDGIPEKPKPDLSRFLFSPMPGLLLSLAVKPGDRVVTGQPLAVIEAMKMQNILRATAEVIIDEIKVAENDNLQADQIIMTFIDANSQQSSDL